MALPSTPIGKCNSDPFKAYPITITPEINNLTTSYRDYIIPSIWYRSFKNKTTMALTAREWQYNAAHLEDEGTAYGIIARHGLVAASCSPSVRELALHYVGQITVVLSREIAQRQALQVRSAISMLTTPRCSLTPKSWLITLRQQLRMEFFCVIAEAAILSGRFDYRMLMHEVYNDCQLTPWS